MEKNQRWRLPSFVVVLAAMLGLTSLQGVAYAAPASGDSSSFAYTGTWSAGWSGQVSWTSGSTALLAVDVASGGGTISLYGRAARDTGKASVSVDGGAVVTVDTYRGTDTNTEWYTSPALPQGRHTLKVTVLGTKNASSTGSLISVAQGRTSNGTIAAPGSTPPPVQPSLAVSAKSVTTSGATLVWDYTAGTDTSAVDAIRVGRDGQDANGSGPWSTTEAVADGQRFFDKLLANTTYTLYAELLKGGQIVGTRKSVQITTGQATPPAACGDGLDNDGDGKVDYPADPGCTSSTDTDETNAVTPPPNGPLATVTLPSNGWLSGGANVGIDGTPANNNFATWRGLPVTGVSTWQDATNADQWGWGLLGGDCGGDFASRAQAPYLDIAIGGPSNWASAAQGSMDAAFRTAMINLHRCRGDRPTAVRPAHEMNGTWYPWSVSASEVADYHATMKRWHTILREVYPNAIWEWSPNGENSSGVPASQLFDPADGWNLIGVDRYNSWANWIGPGGLDWATGANAGTLSDPMGIEKWRQFAEYYGLPLALPEYSNSNVSGHGGDGTYWAQNFYPWLRAHAGKGPGQVMYEGLFNLWTEFALYGPEASGANLNTAQAYRSFFQNTPR